jgi:hypothetical protein
MRKEKRIKELESDRTSKRPESHRSQRIARGKKNSMKQKAVNCIRQQHRKQTGKERMGRGKKS